MPPLTGGTAAPTLGQALAPARQEAAQLQRQAGAGYGSGGSALMQAVQEQRAQQQRAASFGRAVTGQGNRPAPSAQRVNQEVGNPRFGMAYREVALPQGQLHIYADGARVLVPHVTALMGNTGGVEAPAPQQQPQAPVVNPLEQLRGSRMPL